MVSVTGCPLQKSCKSCNFSYWRECEKFVVSSIKKYSKPLHPYKFPPSFSGILSIDRGQVIFASSLNDAKNIIAKVLVEKLIPVSTFTASQAIQCQLNPDFECNEELILLDLKKLNISDNSVAAVQSFIDRLQFENKRIVVCNAPKILSQN